MNQYQSENITHNIEDESIEEFRGGGLQLRDTLLNTGIRGDTNSSNSNRGAVLEGQDDISPISSSPDTPGSNRRLLPKYHLPFGSENPRDFFSNRTHLVEKAIDECNTTLIFPSQDGHVIGSWLLTEINLWDCEKERLVTLTDKAIMTMKYDFIALRQLDFKKIYLSEIDTVVSGDLIYPPSSLVPRLNGITNGISSVVRDCIVDRFTASSSEPRRVSEEESNKKFGFIDMKSFEARNRNMKGVRAMWNKGQPIAFTKQWNPFQNDIPMLTYASHPLYWHKDSTEEATKNLYDVEHFAKTLIETVSNDAACKIHHEPIILRSYVGLPSLIHNKTSLGFFKIRGKFSF